MKKRMLAMLMTLSMIATLLPTVALAADTDLPTTSWADNYDQTWYDETLENYSSQTNFSIETAEEMAAFAAVVNDNEVDFSGKTVSLAADLDMTEHLWMPIGWKSYSYDYETYTSSWSYASFKGAFNGNGNAITLSSFVTEKHDSAYYQSGGMGLFAYTGGNLTIQDLSLYITGTVEHDITQGSYLGALVAIYNNNYADNDTEYDVLIDNCTVVAEELIGYDSVAGILGQAYTDSPITISNCTVKADLTRNITSEYVSEVYVGGIAANIDYANLTSITNCTYSGDIVANFDLDTEDLDDEYIGGISAYMNSEGSVTNCFSSGSITSSVIKDYVYTGGIVGWNYGGPMDNCHSTMDITGSGYMGGLVGYSSETAITDSSTSGDIKGMTIGHDDTVELDSSGKYEYVRDAVGGLVGYFDNGTIDNCYTTGDVSSTDQTNDAGGSYVNGANVGGLVGFAELNILEYGTDYENYTDAVPSSIRNCYTTGDVEGKVSVGGLIGAVYSYQHFGGDNVTIGNCYTTGNITINESDIAGDESEGGYPYRTYRTAGGIVGKLELGDGVMENCYATGTIYANLYDSDTNEQNLAIGGLIGVSGTENDSGTVGQVVDCYFDGAISIDGTTTYTSYSKRSVYVGGFIGGLNDVIDFVRCYTTATGTKNADYEGLGNVSTFVGEVDNYVSNSSNNYDFIDCYTATNLSDLTTTYYEVYAFVGTKPSWNSQYLEMNYQNVYVDSDTEIDGYDDGSIVDELDSETYTIDYKTTENMMNSESYTAWTDFSTHWDITTEWKDSGSVDTAGEAVMVVDTDNSTYPTLKSSKFLTSSDITSVTSPTGLSVESGTAFDKLSLPTTVTGTVGNEETTFVVDWDESSYNTSANPATITGTLYHGADVANGNDKTASITVTFVAAIQMAEIDGTPKLDEAITAKGYDALSDGTEITSGLSYQWKISTTENGTYTNISGATASTYTPVVTDIGSYLKVDVTFDGKTITSAASDAILDADFTSAATNLAAVTAKTSLTVSWDDADPTADSYNIYYVQNDSVVSDVDTVLAGTKVDNVSSGHEITGLTTGKDYYIVVEAVKAGYTSTASDILSASPNSFPTDEGTSITVPETNLYIGNTIDLGVETNGDPVTYAWSVKQVVVSTDEQTSNETYGDDTTISITNATSATPTITANEVGTATVTLVVTSTADTSYVVTKEAEITVQSAITYINGDEEPRVGEEVTAQVTLYNDANFTDETYSYQWKIGTLENGSSQATNIEGATSASYTPSIDDGTKYLFVEVTVTHNGKTETKTSQIGNSAVLEGIPEGTITLTQSGDAKAAEMDFAISFTSTSPALSDYADKQFTVMYAVGEQTDVSDITTVINMEVLDDATTFTAAIPAADRGKTLSFVVSIKADNYDTLYSNIVTGVALATPSSVTITNVDSVAAVIGVETILLDNSAYGDLDDFTYQWQYLNESTWTNIEGATAQNYTIDGAYYQKDIRVVATANSDYITGSVESAEQTINNEATFTAAPVVTAVGSDKQVTLTWTASNPAADSYEIYQGGTKIDTNETITGTSYEVTELTNGTSYNFKVMAIKAGYTDSTSEEVTAMAFKNADSVSVGLTSSTAEIDGTVTATATTAPSDAGPVSYKWTVSPAGSVTFSDDTIVSPTVTAVTAGESTISVTVTNKDGTYVTSSEALTITNNEANLLTFKIDGNVGVFDNTDVAVTVPAGTDVTALVPTFTISSGAAAKVDATEQVSDTTANDFTTAVSFVITAEDGITTKTYTVTVTEADKEALATADTATFDFTDGVATFGAVENAGSYLVQLYLDGVAIGSAVSTTGTNVDLTTAMQANGIGDYSFSVTAIVDSETYTNSVESATGGSYEIVKIVSVAQIATFDVEQGSDNTVLPLTVTATLSDGSTVDVDVTWTGFDSTTLTALLLTGELGTLPTNVINIDSVLCPSLVINVVANIYEITATAGTGGTISPAGSTDVTEGGSVTYTITASSGYSISDVKVDGTSVGSVTTYTFNEVSADHTIAATFSQNSTGGSTSGGNSSSGSTTTSTDTTTNDDGSVTASATTSTSTSGTTVTATVTDSNMETAIENAVDADEGDGVYVEIPVTTKSSTDTVAAVISTDAAQALVDSDVDALVVASDVGSLEIPVDTLEEILSQASGADLTITVSYVDNSDLNTVQTAVIGDATVVDLTVASDGSVISSFGGYEVTVTLPYTLQDGEIAENIVVWYIDDLGNITPMETVYDEDTQTVAFKTTHFSVYAIIHDTNNFTDVDVNAYYYDAVLWALDNNITSGTTDTTFSPDTTCTRAQAVMFLYRAAGEPEVSGDMIFTDVSADAYYYDAVLWAVENGITKGTTETTFSPDANCTRSQIVTFLWNYAGNPVVDYAMDFTDVDADVWYAEAVRWAVSEGITSGTTDTTFAPASNCTRGQIVTFLYRYLAE